MNDLRKNFLDTLRAAHGPRTSDTSQKILIAKSASPDLLTIRNGKGEVLGFASPEQCSPAEIEQMANLDNLNACFDSMFYGAGSMMESSSSSPMEYAQLQKNVDADLENDLDLTNEPNKIFNSVFPFPKQ